MDRIQVRHMPFNETVDQMSQTNDWVQLGMVIIAGIFVIGVLFLVYKLITKPTTTVDSLEIAKQRYAKGELTAAEYSDIKKELK